MNTVTNDWTFFSNQGHILIALAKDPDLRLRDLAEKVGITERAVARLLAEMEKAGVITREKEGRRNHYTINRKSRMRHPIERHKTIGDLLDIFVD